MGFLNRLLGRRVSLVEAVELTGLEIFGHSVSMVRGLIAAGGLPESLGSNRQEFNRTAWDLVLELTIFALHLADRVVFGVLGPDRRAKFMDALVISEASSLAESILTDKSERGQREFQESFFRLYRARTAVYGPLGLPAGGQASLKGTLYWEAAKLSAAEHCPGEVASTTILPSVVFTSCLEALKPLRDRLERLTGV